jgi:hypothetical protein
MIKASSRRKPCDGIEYRGHSGHSFSGPSHRGDETVIVTLQSNLLHLITSAEATVTIHDSPYGQWTVANLILEQLTDPTQSGETADFDADRYNNFVEYSANRNPKLAEANALLKTAIEPDPSDDQNHITLTYTRRLPPTDTAY